MIKKVISSKFLEKTECDSEGYLWYYSYGSNMNKDILEKRRSITPKESKRAIIKDW